MFTDTSLGIWMLGYQLAGVARKHRLVAWEYLPIVCVVEILRHRTFADVPARSEVYLELKTSVLNFYGFKIS